jgi:hypothetical protein
MTTTPKPRPSLPKGLRVSEMIRDLEFILMHEGDVEMELPDGTPLTRVSMVTLTRRPRCGGTVGMLRCKLEVGHAGKCTLDLSNFRGPA